MVNGISFLGSSSPALVIIYEFHSDEGILLCQITVVTDALKVLMKIPI